MNILGLRRVGIATDRYDDLVRFLGDVLQLEVAFEEPTTVEFSTTEGDRVQVMAPGDRYHDVFGAHAQGPVPLFEVDDVEAVRTVLSYILR